jgi:hypothetical protein
MTAMEMCQSLEGLIMMMRHAERNNDVCAVRKFIELGNSS